MLDALGKRLKFDINEEQGLQKLLNGLFDLSFYYPSTILIFLFLQDKAPASDLTIVFELDWSLGDQAASLSKKEERIQANSDYFIIIIN